MQLTQTRPQNTLDTISTSRQTVSPSIQNNSIRLETTNSFSGNIQIILLLIIRLLAQLQGTTVSPPPISQKPDSEVTLSESEKNVVYGLYAADKSGNIDPTTSIVVLDGNNDDKKLNVGDSVVIKAADGSIISKREISVDDLYKIRFRQRLIQYSEPMVRGGWRFDTEVVNITNSALIIPFTRPIEGGNGTEKVLKKDAFWEVVERNGNRMLLQRTSNDNGQPILASEALKHLYQNNLQYSFDCASPISILNLMATLGTVGEDDFNKNAGRLLISSWLDPYDAQSNFDGGFLQRGRAAEANAVTVDGHSNLAGELALFDTEQGDELRPGSTYYFDKPGDNSSAFQGWNAIYLGKDEENIAKFWVPSLGVKHVKFKEGTWIPEEGTFKGYYLGSIVGSPDYLRLEDWDNDSSVLA